MFFSDFRDGLLAYRNALRIIRNQSLWVYMILPGLVCLAFGVLIYLVAKSSASEIGAWAQHRYPWDVGAGLVVKLISFLGGAAVWAGALFTYKYIILIISGPFMSPLSERVEKFLTGKELIRSGYHPIRITREVWRGIRIALRNLIREFALTVAIAICTGIIPFLAVVSGILVFMIQAYFAGFGNLDFTLERHFGVKGSVGFVRSYRGLAVGNGTIFLLLLMIPVIGPFLAPGLSTVAGTLEVVRRLEETP